MNRLTSGGQSQQFSFEGHDIRTIMRDDSEPQFVAADICAVLDIADVSSAVSRLDEDQKGTVTIRTPGGMQAVLAVNESGLYALIFTSRKAQAKRFQKWVTGEVLPAIRRTGRYEVQPSYDLSTTKGLLAAVQRLVDIEDEQMRQADDINRLKAHVGIDKPNPYFTVREYAAYCKRHIGPRAEVKLGKQAARLCGVRHIPVEKVPNPDRAGSVNSYPEDVLQEVFNTWLVQDPLPEEGGAQ